MTRLFTLLGIAAAMAATPSLAQSPFHQLEWAQQRYQLQQLQDTLDSIDARQRDEQLHRDELRFRHYRGSYDDDKD